MKKTHLTFSAIFFLVLGIGTSQSQNAFLKQLDKAVSGYAADRGEVLREQLDSIDFQFAISINEGAGFYDVQQKGENKSKLLYSFKKEEDKSNTEKARDSLEIGIGMYNIRRYEMAEWIMKATKISMENNGLQGEIVYLRLISNIGLISMTQGKLAEANTHISDALGMAEERLGKESAAYIANLNNLAKLNQLHGKYTDAEKLFDEALSYSDLVFGGGKQQAIILNNKAMLYQTLGQYDRAVDVIYEAMAASQSAPKKLFEGEKSFDNRKFKANLATLYQSAGRYGEAEGIFLELKKISEKRRQTKNAEYASILNQMAILYYQMGKTEKVRDLFVASLNVYKKRWGENNIYFAKVANDLGEFHRRMGQYTEAEKWLTKAHDIRKQLLTEKHPDFIKSQESLAILYWKTQRHEKAFELYKDVMNKTIDFVYRFFPPMSEAEKTQFWATTSPRFQRFYNFAIDSYPSNPDIFNDVFNYNMSTKGLLLSATTKVKNIILQSNDQALINEYLEWQDKKEQLARLYGYSKGKLKKQNINLDELESEANQMEKRLSEKSSEFFEAFSLNKNDYKNLTKELNDNEALVDLIRVRAYENEFTDDVKYLALTINNESQTPDYTIIENGAALESKYLKIYRNSIRFKIEDTVSYEQFWAKIEDKVSTKKKIYFSADGIYNQVNMATLLMPDGDYLLNKHDLVLIGNSNDIIKKKASGNYNKEAFLLGYPDYETNAIPKLPGTQKEILSISEILNKNNYHTSSFLEKNATESQIKNVQSPEIVHIATHGFFNKDSDKGNSGAFGTQNSNASENPLLRSGLILAGTGKVLADTLTSDLTQIDNGILTSYEAMNLNLTNTQLVVLSACETGLGEIKSGEGVYGLQRAFQIAGAEALIMSLWKVSDDATQLLMTNFYRNWTKNGNKHIAFRNAQLQLMEQYKEPYYWGAFVMVGE